MAWSHTASSPIDFSGRVERFDLVVAEIEGGEDLLGEIEDRQDLIARSAPAVQKTWASSWVKPRTRIRPCSTPGRS